MFIIWGTRYTEDVMGYTDKKFRCTHCNNVAYQKVFRRDKKFALFWIPLFPLDTEYFWCCPICNFGQKISRDQAVNMAVRTGTQLE